MIGLIKEFANLQNVTQRTARLPIPRAVGESVPRGILTTNLSSEELETDTTNCKQVPAVGWVQPAELYVQLILNATRGCRNQTQQEMVLWDSLRSMTESYLNFGTRPVPPGVLLGMEIGSRLSQLPTKKAPPGKKKSLYPGGIAKR